MRFGPDDRAGKRTFVLLVCVSVAISIAAVLVFDGPSAHESLLRLSNLVGPTTASLLAGRGLTVCTEALGTPRNPICFHGGRMPLPTTVVAVGVRLLGDRYLPVALLKAMLLLLPVEAAMYVACGTLPAERRRRWGTVLVLLLPFGITAFLADVVNLQVEEGYAYSFLALATALVLFREGRREGWMAAGGMGEATVFGMSAAGVYLSKSSMGPAALVLTAVYLLRVRGTAGRGLALALALAGPVGWAAYQHHATGRYSLGTSLDGFNLRKGNNAGFLGRYPPSSGETLDRYDRELNAGVHFADEWSFDDFHRRSAEVFVEGHPGAAARGEVRKLAVIFLSVRKYGSRASHGALLGMELAGMLVFRLMLWAAMGISVVWVVRRRGARPMEGAAFLLLLVAVTLPYAMGFAYTRHVSVLIYPTALMCCRALAERGDDGPGEEGLH